MILKDDKDIDKKKKSVSLTLIKSNKQWMKRLKFSNTKDEIIKLIYETKLIICVFFKG